MIALYKRWQCDSALARDNKLRLASRRSTGSECRSWHWAPFGSSEPAIFDTTDPQTVASIVQLLLEPGDQWGPGGVPEVLPEEKLEFLAPGSGRMTFLEGEYYLCQRPTRNHCISRLFRNPAREKLFELLRPYQRR